MTRPRDSSSAFVKDVQVFVETIDLQSIPITVSPSASTGSIPIEINVTLPEGTSISLNDWAVANGVMIESYSSTQFLFYPIAGVESTFMLRPYAISTETFKSAASSLYTYRTPISLSSFAIPPLRSDRFFYTPESWSIPTVYDESSVTFKFTPTNADPQLIVAVSSSTASFNENRYEINVCGTSSINTVLNGESSAMTTGSEVSCSSEVIVKVWTDFTTLTVFVNDQSVVSTSLASGLAPSYFTFASIDASVSMGTISDIAIHSIPPFS